MCNFNDNIEIFSNGSYSDDSDEKYYHDSDDSDEEKSAEKI